MYLKYVVLSLFLFQPMALAEVGSKYFCEEAEINAYGWKSKLIMEWNDKTVHIKSIKQKGQDDIEKNRKIVFQTDNYFITYGEFDNGKFTTIFNGEMLVTTYLKNVGEESNIFSPKTHVTEYQCEKI